MGEGVPEEGSSSRNGSVVTGRKRGVGGRVQIELADGSSFFVSPEFVDRHELAPGSDVSRELWEALIAEDEGIKCYEKGLELLGRREHSTFELELKLKKREFAEKAVSTVIDRLQKAGYVSDRRYANAWVRHRLKRQPEGYARLAAGLRKRGIDRDTITSVLEEVYTDEESERALAKAATKIMKKSGIDELAVLRKLTAKGFPYRRAKAHLQKLHSSG